MIQQAAQILRRLRERLTGTTSAADLAEVERDARTAVETLLGPQGPLLSQLDPVSAVRLLGDAERVALWVGLLRVQADAQRAAAGTGVADRLSARAAALEQAARAAWP